MHKALFACLLFSGAAVCQAVAMPAHTSTYNGFSRGWSTTALNGFNVLTLDLPIDAQQAGDTAAFLISVNGVAVHHSTGNTTLPVVLAPPLLVNIGDVLRVVGNWSPAVPTNFTAHNSYASGAGGTYSTPIGGTPHTLFRAGQQWDVGDPAYGGTGFDGLTGSIGRINITTANLGGVMPMPPFTSTFTSSLTRGFFFQAPTSFTINGLEVYNEANQSHQAVEIVGFGTTAPPAWPGQSGGTSLFYDNATPTGTVIFVPGVVCLQGNWYGLLGCCTAGIGGATSYNSYGSGNYTSNVLGTPVLVDRFLTQTGIGASGPNQQYSTEPGGSIGRMDVHVTGASGFAQIVPFGQGCNESYASVYENHSAFDLSGTSLMMTMTGSGYVGITGTTAMTTPVSGAVVMGDDQVLPFQLGWTLPYQGGTTTTLYCSSNGFVHLQPQTSSGCCSFNTSMFLSAGPVFAAKWRDLNPSSMGTVHFDSDPVAGTADITFLGVPDYGSTTDLNDFQYHFESNGTVELRFGVCAATSGGTGYSPGNANVDPGSIDISATPVFVTGLVDITPLSLDADARPVLGTSINVSVDNIPAGSILVAHIYGLGQFNPGIDLTSIGMDGCFQYCSQDAVILTISPAGTSAVNVFAIPASPAFVGVNIFGQGAAYDPAGGHNVLGALSSNGIKLTIDAL